jgi:hypothetical protein
MNSYERGIGGARGGLVVSRVLSRRKGAHLPCLGTAAQRPPFLFFQIWSYRVEGGLVVEIEDEARRMWADPAGIVRIRIPLRTARPVGDGRLLRGGILHPMPRRSVAGDTNDESAGPEGDADDDLPRNQRYKSLVDRPSC